MRNTKRIPLVLAAIQKLWEANPDLRLCQLVINLVDPVEQCPQVFYYEDDALLKKLNEVIDNHAWSRTNLPVAENLGQSPSMLLGMNVNEIFAKGFLKKSLEQNDLHHPQKEYQSGNTKNQFGIFVKAIAFAADKHRNQRRKDVNASPYINHPIALSNILINKCGIDDVTVLCAAAPHKTIEETETTADEIQALFGPKIAAVVLEVTDDKSLEKEVRKQQQIEHAPHLSSEANLIKLADKVSNLRDILDSLPADWCVQRKQNYFEWSA